MPIFLIKSYGWEYARINQPPLVSRETWQNDMISALVEANHALL